MKFTRLIKTVDTKDFKEQNVYLDKIKAQYNPERFHLWKSLHDGPEKEVLNMFYSPHYKFLKDRDDRTYYKLQRLYGRDNKWIKAKVNKFLSVLESIKKEGFKESIVILETPLVKNRYNNGFEIFEGHHRISCSIFLGIKEVPCQIIRRK